MILVTKEFNALVGQTLHSLLDLDPLTTKEARARVGAAAVRAVFAIIERQMLAGEKVFVRGIGTFEPTWTPARLGYSREHKGIVVVPGRFRVLFRAGPTLRHKLRDADVSASRREAERPYEEELARKLREGGDCSLTVNQPLTSKGKKVKPRANPKPRPPHPLKKVRQ